MPRAVPYRPLWLVLLVGAVLTAVGLWGLDLQAKQARDTKRKLDLEDLELALNRLLTQDGTLPPADQPVWCGIVSLPVNAPVRAAIETSLRGTKKYEKPEKPFPTDPRWAHTDRDYAYWKTSPVTFELLAHLEADDNNSRPLDLTTCSLHAEDGEPAPRGPVPERGSLGDAAGYDYAIVSAHRTPP